MNTATIKLLFLLGMLFNVVLPVSFAMHVALALAWLILCVVLAIRQESRPPEVDDDTSPQGGFTATPLSGFRLDQLAEERHQEYEQRRKEGDNEN